MDFWDAKSVDFSWKGKTGALHKTRAYGIIRIMLRFTENNEVIRDDAYRAILVGLQTSEDISYSMEELKGLAEAANVEVLGQMIQNLERPNTATLIGKGKVEELAEMAQNMEADTVIFNDELTGMQLRNLEDAVGVRVIDRTILILDIFAARANSREGKLQVELAQLAYRMPRLTGFGKSLSRLGGGIGTRGPGEKKLETDRRIIRDRISRLSKDLEEIKNHREVARQNRSRTAVPVAAIVGYTNAGKSTLLNTLTDADVLEEDQLFATLDPTTRMLELSNHQNLMLTDTVGFIRKLPHHLVDAFKSTLEEAKYADFIIHVVDASNPQWDAQMHVVYMTLQDLGVVDKKILTVFNKCDRITGEEILQDFRADKTLRISAKTGMGLDTLKEVFEDMLRDGKVLLKHTFPYEKAGEIQKIRKYGELLKEEYTPEGIYVEAYVPPEL